MAALATDPIERLFLDPALMGLKPGDRMTPAGRFQERLYGVRQMARLLNRVLEEQGCGSHRKGNPKPGVTRLELPEALLEQGLYLCREIADDAEWLHAVTDIEENENRLPMIARGTVWREHHRVQAGLEEEWGDTDENAARVDPGISECVEKVRRARAEDKPIDLGIED
jgi:hypothetical protein